MIYGSSMGGEECMDQLVALHGKVTKLECILSEGERWWKRVNSSSQKTKSGDRECKWAYSKI